LSKTTAPTTGSVKVKGRIASLLEVGTGFHPELTGRENIYLNGAILGMRKHEITRKLDEIIDFAGVERYIDTPVKRYSSGMYVRLAFGVAAHLESEILIIDEVLAVGDAEFQKKCLGKMGDVAKGEGRTVLFVSHNMVAVQKLCSNVIMLKNGIVLIHGETSDIIANYLNEGKSSSYEFDGTKLKYNQNQVRLNKAWIDKASNATKINIRDSFEIVIELTMLEPLNINLTLMVYGQNDDHILSTASIDEKGNNYSTEKSTYQIKCKVPGNFFNCGNYKIALLVVENYSNILLNVENIFTLEFEEGIQERGGYVGPWNGIVRPKWDWKLNKII
jgi:lipopolysaccharide transport system ATP-binding protein